MPDQLDLADFTIRDKLAFTLFRRHMIDSYEMKRRYEPIDDPLPTEHSIETSWNRTQGRDKNYWFLLARECQKFINQEQPTSLPT